MFGFLVASAPELTPEELNRYRSCYCGLCRCIGERYGELCRLTLNYDMTFLVLLLESLYECDETASSARCVAHPKEKRDYWISDATKYASDMLVILSYFKLLDDWNDDASVGSLAFSSVIKKKVFALKEVYPRQFTSIEKGLSELSQYEKTNSDDADAVCASFGRIMGDIFVWKDDRWRENLYNLGNALGKYIYLADAAVDLKSDTIKNSYNPFRKYYGLENEARFRDILKIFLSEAVSEYEILPLVQDTGILKNILCSGLWARFEEKYGSLQGTGCKPGRNRRGNKKSIQSADKEISSGP